MAWTTPKTDFGPETLTAAQMNAIGANLIELKDPPTAESNVALNYSTTSTSFVNVDGTNLSLSISTAGGDILVHFHGTADNITTATFVYFDVTVNGTRQGNAADGIIYLGRDATGDQYPIAFTLLVTGLAADTYTINLQWRTSGGTARLNNETSEMQFWVREVS